MLGSTVGRHEGELLLPSAAYRRTRWAGTSAVTPGG
ncbi:hypothetical protein SFR_5571 [Streptomyces sp. FR-008]|nr:hypothetical protein SFR_5571 [Streptomyces sp. FR-008]